MGINAKCIVLDDVYDRKEFYYKIMLPAGVITESGERFVEIKVGALEKVNRSWRCVDADKDCI